MNAKERDMLLAQLEALDRDEACLAGTPMVPIHRTTLQRIIAALYRGKRLEEGT